MSLEEKDKQLLTDFQKSWSRHKYWVMSRSQQSYNEIRKMAGGNDWNCNKQVRYEQILKELDCEIPTEKTLTVTFQHIWGYFKKSATQDERERYFKLILDVKKNNYQIERFLIQMTGKYEEPYLKKIKWMSE